VPAGLLVHGSPGQLREVFGALVDLQPVEWTGAGLLCAPRAAPEGLAGPAIAACPLPVTRLPRVPDWPAPPARWLAGWYVRGLAHAPAPPGVRELVQVPGEGFGPGGHPTTAMCLTALERLPAGPAVDLGCGSGLLAQAWARLDRGPVLAVDLDEAALRQAADGLTAAGLAATVTLEHGPVARAAGRLGGATVLANMPVQAHHSMLACMHADAGGPLAVVCSGLRPGTGMQVARGYAAGGRMRITAASRHRGWECWSLRA